MWDFIKNYRRPLIVHSILTLLGFAGFIFCFNIMLGQGPNDGMGVFLTCMLMLAVFVMNAIKLHKLYGHFHWLKEYEVRRAELERQWEENLAKARYSAE
jgi:hypothetical protein